ncbi:MAG: PASTA domain-containing protein [Bacillota bacterium]|nr:PASTA domain-containing protein [Bacillota bacterium]
MDENQFLNSYKKKLGDQKDEPVKPGTSDEPASSMALRYEEKTAFVQPHPINGSGGNQGRSQSKIVPGIIVVAIILVLTLFLIWLFTRGVTVIDLTDWTLNDAQLWAGDNGIRLQVEEQYDDTYEADKIIKQDPLSGSSLKKGGFLKVTVSLGHDLSVTLPLPDFLAMTMGEVEAWAEENFMTKVRITTDFSDEVETGNVISYEINDDTVVNMVRRDTPIYVIVSKGEEPKTEEQITIPDFKVMSVNQSQLFAIDNGLVLKIIEQFDDYTPSGTIIAQSEDVDSQVDKGTEITLTVSKGKKILVPNFADYTRQKASAVAADLGINVTMTERYSSRSIDSFLSQSLEVGSIYQAGEILELVYSMGNKIVLYSFVGQTRAAIESWAQDLNEKGASIRISVTQTQNNAAKDTIIYQDKTNIVIGTSTTIRITVSLGRTIFVPDLVAPEGSGYDKAITRDKALAMCEELGLIPIFVSESKTGRLPGEIWHQSVAAGKEVYENTTITLKYHPADVTIQIPDFTGMTQEAVLEAEYLKKLNITFILLDFHVEGFSNVVYQQSISAGKTVVSGTDITLTISPEAPPEITEEPEPTPTEEPAEPTPAITAEPEPTPAITAEPEPTPAG